MFRDYQAPTSAKASTSDQVSTVILVSGSDHMSSVPPTEILGSKSRPKIKIKPPKKPDSSFTLYVKQHRNTLTKRGLSDDEALNKAVKAWRNTTTAVKNKYQNKYEKLKAKYDVDIRKYNEKIKNKERQKTAVVPVRKKGEFAFILLPPPIYAFYFLLPTS